jgi:multisubunit Na+/H+ antiporter MnhG subunit
MNKLIYWLITLLFITITFFGLLKLRDEYNIRKAKKELITKNKSLW